MSFQYLGHRGPGSHRRLSGSNPVVKCASHGVGQNNFDIGALLLQVQRHACQRAAGAYGASKGVDTAIGLAQISGPVDS